MARGCVRDPILPPFSRLCAAVRLSLALGAAPRQSAPTGAHEKRRAGGRDEPGPGPVWAL
jgi:hypothetical protein